MFLIWKYMDCHTLRCVFVALGAIYFACSSAVDSLLGWNSGWEKSMPANDVEVTDFAEKVHV